MPTATKKPTATAKLEQLDRQVAETRATARKVEERQRGATARVVELERDFAAAESASKSTAKLETALAEAQRDHGRPWGALRDAAAAKVREVRRERAEFINANLEELLADYEPRAREAVASVEDALRETEDALDRWHAIAQEVTALLVDVQGIGGDDLPAMPGVFDVARREVGRARNAELPLPLPRSVGPAALPVAPKTRTASGGYAPTLLDARGEVVPQ